ncbi:Do family serine endopeptidase [uncultured Methylovirgula sp.]|uniref:Do family serine endopeptidase n=1 Tax=uncultured Methylovirgula sp. TaxID=1285960 RepID=UPI002618F5B6|nr:Do family serine endopeptidase [uncultured Methylovirgula sp.]
MTVFPHAASACVQARKILLAGALGLAVMGLGAVAPALADQRPDSFADLAAAVSDAVVNISATQAYEEKDAGNGADVDPGTPFDDLFDQFLRHHQQGGGDGSLGTRERSSNSLGSGFVIDPSGIVITNNHVIADSNEVTVIFTDGTKLKARVIGKDSKVDVAVLKVNPTHPLKAVKFGDSDKMRVGDWVIAVGNPFGLGGTVTAGIVSARHRDIDSGPYDNYIQTDAAINKGNSGGPLFNEHGEVIGINTAILSPSGGSIGIGFATPSDTVAPIIDQLRTYGETRRGWLGVRIQSIDDSIAESLDLGKVRGALVAGTDVGGPAAAAGIETGDVIVKFDGVDVAESHDLPKLVASAPVGKEVAIVIVRQGHELTKMAKLGRLEDAAQKASLTTGDLGQGKALLSTPLERALGMALAPLNETSRLKYAIKDSVTAGVVVTGVDANSPAAQKNILPGEVILEINQDPVHAPADIARKMRILKTAGKKWVLLLVSTPQGEERFVAVNL